MRASIILVSVLSSAVTAIWPAPVSFTTGNSVVWISKDLKVSYNNASIVWWTPSRTHFRSIETEQVLRVQSTTAAKVPASNATSYSSEDIVQGAVARALDTILTKGLVPWKLIPRNTISSFEPDKNAPKTYVKTLAITQTGADSPSTFKPLAGQVDESYKLTVAADGTAAITAVSSTGVLHALESFIQLFYEHTHGDGMYSNMAPVAISDAPKFPHRGLNMDISRNWYPMRDIQRTIDAISMNKFNRIHLHMTDSQSWPMEVPALPDLARKGAYGTSYTYSPSDISNIQDYAIRRGVEVIIEFDMPGHTTAIGYAYPDLIAGFDAKPWDSYCSEPPCGSLKLNSPAVNDFLEKLFDDVLPRVKPYSSYFHTGGDEVNANVYTLDETVRSNDTAVIGALIQKLVDRNHAQLRAAGLTPIVWEEMLLQWNVTLGSDVLVQTWQSDAAVSAVTAQGHKALAGNYNFWYLDCGHGQWLNFDNGASFQTYYPFADYCSPTKNWRLVYSYDPLAGVPANQTHLVMGGEVHIWSEQTDPVNVDDLLWPRASAAGEVLWSSRHEANGQNRSQITAAPRLAEMRERMVRRGVNAGPVQMVFCTQANATECAL